MAEAPSFFASVYALVAQIPPGFVASYGQLARMLGAPLAARQVGWAMRRCPDELPWQRVIREDGTIAGGEYAPLRRAMLESKKSLAEFALASAKKMEIIFSGGVYVGENTARLANVRRARLRRALRALQRAAAPFKREPSETGLV